MRKTVRALGNTTRTTTARTMSDMRKCPSQLLGCDVPDTSWDVAGLPFSIGSLGLRSARRVSPAAHWATWADCLHTVQSKHPSAGEQITAALTDHVHGHHLQTAVASKERLLDVLLGPTCKEGHSRGRMSWNMPGAKKHGWQRGAAQKLEDCFVSGALSCGAPFPI